jgi:hypothetical protein
MKRFETVAMKIFLYYYCKWRYFRFKCPRECSELVTKFGILIHPKYDSGFYSRSDVLDSHTEHNPIYNIIKVCTKTRLGLDYNSSWGEAPSPRKVPRSGKFQIFEKIKCKYFHNDKRSKLDTKLS